MEILEKLNKVCRDLVLKIYYMYLFDTLETNHNKLKRMAYDYYEKSELVQDITEKGIHIDAHNYTLKFKKCLCILNETEKIIVNLKLKNYDFYL